MNAQQINDRIGLQARRARTVAGRGLRAVLRVVLAALRRLWALAVLVARGIGTAILALIIVFEEWGWRPLAELLSLLARFRIWARVEGWVASLPPYGALVVFALPSTLLFPLKLLALALLAKGQAITAAVLLGGAKVAGTAVVARIFMLTKPRLMQIGWFARAYAVFTPWKDALVARVHESWAWRYGRLLKAMMKRDVKRLWAVVVPRLRALAAEARTRTRLAWNRVRFEIEVLGGRSRSRTR